MRFGSAATPCCTAGHAVVACDTMVHAEKKNNMLHAQGVAVLWTHLQAEKSALLYRRSLNRRMKSSCRNYCSQQPVSNRADMHQAAWHMLQAQTPREVAALRSAQILHLSQLHIKHLQQCRGVGVQVLR